jgi:hypothetical protein
MIGGRRCLKVMGIERWRYPSGQVTGVRPITLWIDAETYLIRKVFEDTPKNVLHGVIDRQNHHLRASGEPLAGSEPFSFHGAGVVNPWPAVRPRLEVSCHPAPPALESPARRS